jgi:hypothetical protein
MAQERAPVWWPAALQDGELTVWMVRKATSADKMLIAQQKLNKQIQPIKSSEERTLAEFGQPSSTVGQTAGSYGQTSGSFGATASSTGQTAGSAGKSPSELGTSASNAGQVSSSYGQTAGSFGQTASSFGAASSDSNKPAGAKPHPWDKEQEAIVGEVRVDFPGLAVRYVDVTDIQLKEKLDAAKGTSQYPDAIVGTEYVPWWEESGLGVAMLGEWPWFKPIVYESGRSKFGPGTVDLLRDAPHPRTARAFWILITGSGDLDCRADACKSAFGPGTEEPVRAAKAALVDMLSGTPLGDLADKDAAEYDAGAAQSFTLHPEGRATSAPNGEMSVDALAASTGGDLAAVLLRATISSNETFGVLNAAVMLRKSASGAWKVLQVSPNLRPSETMEAYGGFAAGTRGGRSNAKPLQPVSLASPPEGDARSLPIDLWWDNNGQASVEIVEWQMRLGGSSWLNSQLMVTGDSDPRMQTRVPARFLHASGSYRVRVWSVAPGRVAMTPWRTFKVLPQ